MCICVCQRVCFWQHMQELLGLCFIFADWQAAADLSEALTQISAWCGIYMNMVNYTLSVFSLYTHCPFPDSHPSFRETLDLSFLLLLFIPLHPCLQNSSEIHFCLFCLVSVLLSLVKWYIPAGVDHIIQLLYFFLSFLIMKALSFTPILYMCLTSASPATGNIAVKVTLPRV